MLTYAGRGLKSLGLRDNNDMGIRRWLCYAWVAPTTALGLLLALLAIATGGRLRIIAGVLEVYGGATAWLLRHGTLLKGGAHALTLGHIVLGRDRTALDLTRAHERVHVCQCERWGPLFIPAYLLGSVYAWLRRRDMYRDNPFEREAFRSGDGGQT